MTDPRAMTDPMGRTDGTSTTPGTSRRHLLKMAVGAAAVGAVGTAAAMALKEFVHTRLREVGPDEMKDLLAGMKRDIDAKFDADVSLDALPPLEGVVFGYGLDLTRCNGNRACVYACVEENNQCREVPEEPDSRAIHWITVLEMDKGRGVDVDHSTAYYDSATVPEEGKFYFPVQCQQCANPPCTKVCPVQATWQEDDGIVVVDYDHCIGCRCCMSACPYGARHFNWSTPQVPAEELNPRMHVLGNRPRPRGVVEKCTFCIQRTRRGEYPACHEACPTGARVFGNLLDPQSEIRQLIERKRVFVFKAELNTKPRFFYFYG